MISRVRSTAWLPWEWGRVAMKMARSRSSLPFSNGWDTASSEPKPTPAWAGSPTRNELREKSAASWMLRPLDDDNQVMDLPDAAPVLQLIEDFRRSKAMFTAVSLGVFDALEGAPATARELADRLSVQVDPLERLLDTCVG